MGLPNLLEARSLPVGVKEVAAKVVYLGSDRPGRQPALC